MRTVFVIREAVKRSLEVLWWAVAIRWVALPIRNQRAEEHEQSDWSLKRDERGDHPGQRMADQHEVRGWRERGSGRRRVVGERRGALIGGQVHRDRCVAASSKLWNQGLPAPGSVPGSVHQPEGRHGCKL